jgi:endogenous inhibitor of DNA gyrase (YacG/DUF329 family)
MANLECRDCGDLVDVEARSIVLPFVCKWCQEGFQASTTDQEPIPALDEQFELDSVLIADLEKQLAEANRNTECWKDQCTAILTGLKSADIKAKDSEAKSASLDQNLRESEASVQYWKTATPRRMVDLRNRSTRIASSETGLGCRSCYHDGD